MRLLTYPILFTFLIRFVHADQSIFTPLYAIANDSIDLGLVYANERSMSLRPAPPLSAFHVVDGMLYDNRTWPSASAASPDIPRPHGYVALLPAGYATEDCTTSGPIVFHFQPLTRWRRCALWTGFRMEEVSVGEVRTHELTWDLGFFAVCSGVTLVSSGT
ncbi:hypothetical protein EIP86_008820 [Pleurotus ostreatoroseus]|nr:hypothetical protein EIP86_008820 [Pleurotus ostreatoroseus]